MIVRFRSKRLRDSVDRARTNLKTHNLQQTNVNIFYNEDMMAYLACQAKKDKRITDCWTTDGKILVIDLTNNIVQISSVKDMAKY